MTDYLWDKSGTPDPEIERLEGLLARYRRRPRRRRALVLVAGSLALVAAALLLVAMLGPDRPEHVEVLPAWQVTWIEGTGEDRLRLGDWLETGDGGRARVKVADIGRVDLDENTRVQLAATGETEHRLDLRRGRLRAVVHAPPRLFLVDTPAATAVDLGCAYTLEVDEEGKGLLRVDSGYVELEGRDGHDSYVPRGASCSLGGGGAGVPWFPGAPEGLLDPVGPGLEAALAASVRRDALTLWHLIARVDAERRARVVDRLAELAPPPPGAPLDRVRELDAAALLAWRDALPLP